MQRRRIIKLPGRTVRRLSGIAGAEAGVSATAGPSPRAAGKFPVKAI